MNRKVDCDVLVIGGGNAALSATISAREQGARVLLLECAPKHSRGGNSRHTRNMRLMHETLHDPFTGVYPEEEYWEDYQKVTEGLADQNLARMTISESSTCVDWLKSKNVRFQPALEGTLHTARTNAWFLGGGKALMNALYAHAESIGVDIRYKHEVTGMDIRDGVFHSASVMCNSSERIQVSAGAVVAAAGGFQSNLKWLKDIWGEPAEKFLVRGTPYNKGSILRILLDANVQPVGEPSQGHMVPIDARSPVYDGGIVTRLDCVPLGVMVNKEGERFYDEGEDFWPMRYAIWGRLVAQQTDQIAYCFTDAKTIDCFLPSVFPPVEGRTVGEVAEQFGLPVDKVNATIEAYNCAVRPGGTFNHKVLDDCITSNLEPPKTHWAQRIDTSPIYGYPLRPGVTFTYYGVKVNDSAQVIMKSGKPSKNIFAAGEIMSGNILPKGYVGGLGLVIGQIFGRRGGVGAANIAQGV